MKLIYLMNWCLSIHHETVIKIPDSPFISGYPLGLVVKYRLNICRLKRSNRVAWNIFLVEICESHSELVFEVDFERVNFDNQLKTITFLFT